MPEIPEAEYSLFQRELPRDIRLPATYGEWHALFAHEDQTHRAAGLETEHMVIRYREFDGFISRIALKPSYDALKTYATYVYRKMEAAGLHVARPRKRPELEQ